MAKCYGKIPSKHRESRLFFGTVPEVAQLPDPPAQIMDTAEVPFAMFGNDRIGDCTCAALGNSIIAQTALAKGSPVGPADTDVIGFYAAVSGYNPLFGTNDNGADEDDVMTRFQQYGLGGYRSDGWANVDPQNYKHVMQARWVYGGLFLGIKLPQSFESQFDAGQPITVPWFSPILGYHEVYVADYSADGLFVVSWARRLLVPWAFVRNYGIDAHVAASSAYLQANGTTPGNLSPPQLVSDLPYVQG